MNFTTRLTLLLVLLVLAPLAGATGVTNLQEAGNAITQCRGALPAYETLLRSRPLAVINESTRSSFVNCGWSNLSYSGNKKTVAFGVVLENQNTAVTAVQCVAVIGQGSPSSARYLSRTVYVPAATSPAEAGRLTVYWTGDQNSGQPYRENVSLQCLLPPRVGINEVLQKYTL